MSREFITKNSQDCVSNNNLEKGLEILEDRKLNLSQPCDMAVKKANETGLQ